MVINILISLNLILIALSSYILSLYITLTKNVNQNKAVEVLAESNLDTSNNNVTKIVLVVLSLIIVSYVGYNVANYMSDTALFKVAKVIDKGLTKTIDYIFPPETVMTFVEKSSGLDVIIEINGEHCIIKVLDNLEKCMKPLNELLIKHELQKVMPSDETLNLAFSIWS